MLLKAPQSTVLFNRLAALFALALVVPAYAGSSDISAVGAIETADCHARTIKVLGITFAATNAGSIAAACEPENAYGLHYVSITGDIEADGSIKLNELVSLSIGQYVPGVTSVYLSGPVSVSRLKLGIVGISEATVASAPENYAEGSIVETLGTQPVLGGVILADTMRPLAKSEPQNARINLDSSIGSGFSINSSIVSGTSVNSSIGSGKSVNSSIGSGISVNSSIGSGKSINSSIGSGISVNSSIGSGKSVNSSIGSGISVNSSIGSGKSVNSSIGSGISVNSSIGSGKSINSSIGSGISANSSIGSGRSVNSSVGSGIAVNSSLGSGID